ncbi:hypothetical protein [Lacisediminimonas sp.]|uniref:hypothetical protein n=1 Tax=Lacisediminimonas sp. TaxID=3060582 RepID=UPI00271BA80D|nr:hypothetical protein [Lacisediminimonas sp.]MDO8299057.1 hypothetical protein [Lacisediminimonas sp.]
MKKLSLTSETARNPQRAPTPLQQGRQPVPTAPQLHTFDEIADDLLLKIVEQLKRGIPSIQFARDVHNFSLVSRRCMAAATRYGEWDTTLDYCRALAVDLQRGQLAMAVESAALSGVSEFYDIDDRPPKRLRQLFDAHSHVRIDLPRKAFSGVWAGLAKWASQLTIRQLELNGLVGPDLPHLSPGHVFESRLNLLNRLLEELERHPGHAGITVAILLTGPGAIRRPGRVLNTFLTNVITSDMVTSLRLHSFPGLFSLVRSVPSSRVLTHLDLRGNGIGEPVTKAGEDCLPMMVSMIQRSKSLKTLDLRDNPIPVKDAQALLVVARECGVNLLLG